MSRHRYETAGHAAIALLQELPGFAALDVVVLVRDLHGRVRIAWRPGASLGGPDIDQAGRMLDAELGGWFRGPILSAGAGRVDARRVAQKLVDMSEPWPGPAEVQDPRSTVAVQVGPSWRLLSRRLAKHVWLDGPPTRPPWPLRAQTPPIVAFHSFKGGVGRSTALAICAWQLAEAGERVVCVDLDLESPGLDRVFQVPVDMGVLDFLLDWGATGEADVGAAIVQAEVHGVAVDVLPAGWVDRAYVEKLARLDFLAGAGGTNPTADGLAEVLRQLRRRGYTWILVDSRSGLSDLAGIALISFAHVDVLVARGNAQGAMGLRLTSALLARRRRPEEQRLIVAHALAPLPLDGSGSQMEQGRLRTASWEAFRDSFYAGQDDIPGVGDDTGPHVPLVLPELDEIKRAEAIGSVEESTLRSERYRVLTARIRELAAPEEGS